MYASNQLMFPHSVIASLQGLRGPKWSALVGRVATLGETDEECLAFMLMMIRLNGCVVCETDSYRAMRGCGACAVQTLRRYKGSDEELLAAYATALDDVRRYQVRISRSVSV
jgi:hypothetical protein